MNFSDFERYLFELIVTALLAADASDDDKVAAFVALLELPRFVTWYTETDSPCADHPLVVEAVHAHDVAL